MTLETLLKSTPAGKAAFDAWDEYDFTVIVSNDLDTEDAKFIVYLKNEDGTKQRIEVIVTEIAVNVRDLDK